MAIGSLTVSHQTFSRNNMNRQTSRPSSFNSGNRIGQAPHQPFKNTNGLGRHLGLINRGTVHQAYQVHFKSKNWHASHGIFNRVKGHAWYRAVIGMNRRAPYPTFLNNSRYRQGFTMNRPAFYLLLNSADGGFTYQNPAGSNLSWSVSYVKLGQQQGQLTYNSGSTVLKVVTVRVTGVSYFPSPAGQNRPMLGYSSNQTTTCLAPGNSITINYDNGANLLLLFTKSTTATCNP